MGSASPLPSVASPMSPFARSMDEKDHHVALTSSARRQLQEVLYKWRHRVALRVHVAVPMPPSSWPRMSELTDGFLNSPETLQAGLWVAPRSPITRSPIAKSPITHHSSM